MSAIHTPTYHINICTSQYDSLLTSTFLLPNRLWPHKGSWVHKPMNSLRKYIYIYLGYHGSQWHEEKLPSHFLVFGKVTSVIRREVIGWCHEYRSVYERDVFIKVFIPVLYNFHSRNYFCA